MAAYCSGWKTRGWLWQYGQRKLQRGRKTTEQSFPGQSRKEVSKNPLISTMVKSDLNPKHEIRNSKQFQIAKFPMLKTNKRSKIWFFENSDLFRISIFGFWFFICLIADGPSPPEVLGQPLSN